MKLGLIIGKFKPLHLGHIALIEFAQEKCNGLIVLICVSDKEDILGSIRLQWIEETFKSNGKIKPIVFNYSEAELPNTSVSSKDVSRIWAAKIETLLPKIDFVFSSEKYGDYLSEFLNCKHVCFDESREIVPVSASKINVALNNHWDFIAPAAKPYFVKKICLYGTESTGKSTLTEILAKHFKTDFVPEMARDIIEETEECTEEHLLQIASLQAKTINEKILKANKLLFVDTDVNITSSYSQYLFNKKLEVEDWIMQANKFDLYLFLDNDAPYVQDDTRLDKQQRDELHFFHKKQLDDKGIKYEIIRGNWEERFQSSVSLIEKMFINSIPN
jgi:HTH-type transcriptional regulator, transcriptional repressor of NAD biosynthesis genes